MEFDRYHQHTKAFTLIELLISMTILSFISVSIYQNTSQSFDLRDKLETSSDFYNSIRVTFDLIARDLTQVYTPQKAALPLALFKADQLAGSVAGAPPLGIINNVPPTKFWGESLNAQGIRSSRFQGEPTRISFVTNAHLRLFRNSPESDFARITYALEEDKISKKGLRTLVKYEDPNVFAELDKTDGEVRYVLLNNVKNISFKFLDGPKDSWNTKWDTISIDHPGIFPSVIELTLELESAESRATENKPIVKIQQRFRPELAI